MLPHRVPPRVQALRGWSDLIARFAARPLDAAGASSAVEAGALYLHTASHAQQQAASIDEAPPKLGLNPAASDSEDCASQLGDLAARVRRAHPDLFRCVCSRADAAPAFLCRLGSRSPHALPGSCKLATLQAVRGVPTCVLGGCRASPTADGVSLAMREQLLAVVQTLCEDVKFRLDPFEWVYEGYGPLLVPCVLQSKCVVGRRPAGRGPAGPGSCCARQGRQHGVLCRVRECGLRGFRVRTLVAFVHAVSSSPAFCTTCASANAGKRCRFPWRSSSSLCCQGWVCTRTAMCSSQVCVADFHRAPTGGYPLFMARSAAWSSSQWRGRQRRALRLDVDSRCILNRRNCCRGLLCNCVRL